MGKKKKRRRHKKLAVKKKVQKNKKQIRNEYIDKLEENFNNIDTSEGKIKFLDDMINSKFDYDEACYLEVIIGIESSLGKERNYKRAEEVLLDLIKRKPNVYDELYGEMTRDLIKLNIFMDDWKKVESYLVDFSNNYQKDIDTYFKTIEFVESFGKYNLITKVLGKYYNEFLNNDSLTSYAEAQINTKLFWNNIFHYIESNNKDLESLYNKNKRYKPYSKKEVENYLKVLVEGKGKGWRKFHFDVKNPDAYDNVLSYITGFFHYCKNRNINYAIVYVVKDLILDYFHEQKENTVNDYKKKHYYFYIEERSFEDYFHYLIDFPSFAYFQGFLFFYGLLLFIDYLEHDNLLIQEKSKLIRGIKRSGKKILRNGSCSMQLWKYEYIKVMLASNGDGEAR